MQDRELLRTHHTLEHLRERSQAIGGEFLAGFEAVEKIDRPAVSCFGSARSPEGSHAYELARATARLFAEAGWAVVTGGGPGVMEAANRGCREGGGLSIGFGIELPHEQGLNDYLDISLTFDHFYARKTMFVKAAEGFCVFPGGFGTADELFEALVLIQTGKVIHFPVVLLGEAYWTPLLEWVRRSALADGMVSAEDLALLTLTDEPRVALETVIEAYRAGDGVSPRPREGGRAVVELRDLPSVDELAREAGDPLAVDAARAVIERAREEIRAGADPGDLAARLRQELAEVRRPRLRRVLNATGVVVHTNLGRAPLAAEALALVVEAGRGYSNLEYDLGEGRRGSRQDHVATILRRLTGAEAALVVNNNAAAVLLALAALAEGREVVVSRGELIEIGDGFRIPDVLARSGARLVEVGTTNRTRAADYERAIGPETALLLRVHQSNFRVVGFEELPRLEEVAAVARLHDLPLVDDLGSGHVSASNSLLLGQDEPTARESLAAGADLVCFSGDKLLGGPQAGIVLGSAELVERLRRHPLQRALRIDKLSLAALEGTLLLHLEAPERIPVLRTLAQQPAVVRERAERLAAATGGEVEETVGRVGGGALPLAELPSFACALEESLAGLLRRGDPPVVGVVRDGRLLLDCLTLTDEEADEVAAVVSALSP